MQLTFGIVASWVCLWITTVILFIFIHFFIIECVRNRPVYWHWGLIRVFFGLLYGLPLYFLGWWEVILITIFQATSHFALYNPGLNKIRSIKYEYDLGHARVSPRYDFWYLGGDSGWFDKLLYKLGPTFYQSFYFACVGLAIISLIAIFARYLSL